MIWGTEGGAGGGEDEFFDVGGDHGIEDFNVRVCKEPTNLHLGHSEPGLYKLGNFVQTLSKRATDPPRWIGSKTCKGRVKDFDKSVSARK